MKTRCMHKAAVLTASDDCPSTIEMYSTNVQNIPFPCMNGASGNYVDSVKRVGGRQTKQQMQALQLSIQSSVQYDHNMTAFAVSDCICDSGAP